MTAKRERPGEVNRFDYQPKPEIFMNGKSSPGRLLPDFFPDLSPHTLSIVQKDQRAFRSSGSSISLQLARDVKQRR